MYRAGASVCLIALALALPAAATAAAPSQPAQQSPPEQLGEVLVEGTRDRIKDPQAPLNWLARLVGRFVVDGSVDLHAKGNPADFVKVQGRAECIGFGIGPGVQCQLKVRWPETKGPNGESIAGGESALNPAVMLFGFEKDQIGIHYMLVDSKGFAEKATGVLVTADQLQARAACGATRGNCERQARITADPDLKTVEMVIDQLIDQKKAVRFTFVMHRVPGSPAIVFGRKTP